MPNNFDYDEHNQTPRAKRVQVVTSSGAAVDTFGGSATITPPSSIGDGLKVVTTSGTAVALAASTACSRVWITANATNTGTILVGGTTVVAASGATRRGYALQSGDSVIIDIDNLSKVFIDSTVNGEGVHYTYVAP